MALLEIETLNNPILRQKARTINRVDSDLQQLIDDMIDTMRDAKGVGLAGPQVNQRMRLAIIETLPNRDDEGIEIENSRELIVVINPEIVWRSRSTIDGIEGCLSIPGWLGEVARPDSVRVRALDRHGKKIRLRLKGWDARIIQHEIDHLDGILFIDRLTDPEKLWPEEEFLEGLGEEEAGEIPVG